MIKLTLKKMKELHKQLGGNAKGYFITVYGMDKVTGKFVNVEERIARAERKTASADDYLVKGKIRK